MLRVAASRFPVTALYSHAPALTHAASILWSSTRISARRNSSRRLFDHRRPCNALYPSQPRHVVKPEPPSTWISDYGNYIDTFPEQTTDAAAAFARTSALNEQLAKLHADTGAEFAICAVNNLGLTHPYGNGCEAFGQFSHSLFNEWGIGRCGMDNGLLLVVFCEGRRVEIVCGKGLMVRSEQLQASELARMQQTIMIPLLKQRDFGGAIESGAHALLDAVYESAPTAKQPMEHNHNNSLNNGFGGGKAYKDEGSDRKKKKNDDFGGNDDDSSFFEPWMMIYPTAMVIGAYLYMSWNEYQKLRCLKCGGETIQANGDTLELSSGEQVECELGSCSYESRSCPKCKMMKKVRHVTASSSYCTCSSCGYLTAAKTKRTTAKPTYDSPGTSLVTETCQHCHETKCYESTIPPRKDATEHVVCVSSEISTSRGTSSPSIGSSSPPPSRSSGGFGGGSSRGGSSAGSSWFMPRD